MKASHSGPMFFDEQRSGDAVNQSIVRNTFEPTSLTSKDAAATTNDVTEDMGNGSSIAPALNMGFEPLEEDLEQVTQLCNLTVELCKHPLHKAASPTRSLPHPRAIATPPDSTHPTSEIVRLADLEIGRLLSMTAKLSNMVAQIGSMDPPRFINELGSADPSSHRQRLQARSTILLVLSCYSRLEVIFLSTLDALREVHKSGKPLEDSHQLMPGLVVDGFPLGTCQDLQLRFAIQLCEQTLEIIRKTTGQCGKANPATLSDIGDALAKLLTP